MPLVMTCVHDADVRAAQKCVRGAAVSARRICTLLMNSMFAVHPFRLAPPCVRGVVCIFNSYAGRGLCLLSICEVILFVVAVSV